MACLAMKAWKQWALTWILWYYVYFLLCNCGTFLFHCINAKNIACISQGGWIQSSGGLSIKQKTSPPSHLCETVIFSPDIWWCPWQHRGLHEVRSHVLGLVKSVAQMFNLFQALFQSQGRDYLHVQMTSWEMPTCLIVLLDCKRKISDGAV